MHNSAIIVFLLLAWSNQQQWGRKTIPIVMFSSTDLFFCNLQLLPITTRLPTNTFLAKRTITTYSAHH